ncbi:MAG: succinate dehydrogenase, cytochrome b556 subunit [Sphingomonas sp.]|uniref:succinate dehydrogenase, cytochrome b556 subunit n=1 Tax=Sphingomonas sp. TaxID=28214 RepID=UPI0012262870|nr:succinate dehydrogenase, cytochrome b556 subunit [Sphingomonas sp.]THD34859.1 MAG: succinate dehydrogenase, cytochrome b556 subunit [Sphingomonas sp.]
MATTPPKPDRPLSPHLGHYRMGPHMLTSIIHRITGDGLAIVGGLLFTWWLAALAAGKDSYDWFLSWFTGPSWNILGYIVGVGLTLALFQHMMSGIRHLVLDTGAGYELKTNKTSSILTFVGAVVLTILFWGLILKDVIFAGAK